MPKIGIAFSTKDRVELSRRTVEPLLQHDKFDLHWVDGSTTEEGQQLAITYSNQNTHINIRGGADAAIVYGLTTLLADGYDYVGLVENDVLLAPDWFDKTFALFAKGAKDGLTVGAVSARCYADRMLCQRDGYALMHNLGAGMVIFTAEAARLALAHFRTTFTIENRAVFAQLTGVDIGRYWAFKGGEHWLCADWGMDKVLATHGLASLALTPSCAGMIGQVPSLEDQGLTMVDCEIDEFRKPALFDRFAEATGAIRHGKWWPRGWQHTHHQRGSTLYFPHELQPLSSRQTGDWRLKWTQGFGPFSWCAGAPGATLTVPIFGPCQFMVGGAPEGGQVLVEDSHSGFQSRPQLPPSTEHELITVDVPGGYVSRDMTLTALTPGVVFYGLQTAMEQPMNLLAKPFDWTALPPV